MGGIEGNRDEANSLHGFLAEHNKAVDDAVMAAIDNALAKIQAKRGLQGSRRGSRPGQGCRTQRRVTDYEIQIPFITGSRRHCLDSLP